MINPGGSPGTSFNKSATTRFNNNQINAARALMPFNKAAQDSLRNQTSSANPSGPPVGTQNNDPAQLLSGLEPPAQGPVGVPTGGPQLPVEQTQEFDPEVFRENMLDELVGTIRTQKFLNSPRVKDAVASVRLKNFFNHNNPERIPDNRNLITQVLSRLQIQ
jgi:hypothetical protein